MLQEVETVSSRGAWIEDTTFTLNGATIGITKVLSQMEFSVNTPFDKSIYAWGTNHALKIYNVPKNESSLKLISDDGRCIGLNYGTPGSPYPFEYYPITQQWAPDQKNITNVNGYLSNMVTKFPYNAIVCGIKVYTQNGNTYDLDTYFSSHATEDVASVYGEMYVGITTPRRTDLGLATFCTYKIDSTQYLTSPIGVRIANNDTKFPIIGFAENGVTYLRGHISFGYNKFIFGDSKYYKLTYDDTGFIVNVTATKNEIIKEALNYGFIICTGDARTCKLDDDNVYIPITSNDGIVSDKYTKGNENKNNPNYNVNDAWNSWKFNPNNIDPNQYTNKIELKAPGLTTTGIFNRTFALTPTNVNSLANYLWNADESIFTEVVKGLALMGGNPIDGLIDLRLYPFDCAAKAGGGKSESIVVGRTDTKVNGLKINSYNAILEMGSCTFHRKFENFLDYEPFTTASLYIPYVGIVPISTADFMGQTISCKMVVDITTGSCTAIVFANDIPLIYKNGNIGVEIPMTGTNSAEYASRIAGGLTSGATDIALGAASKSVGQVVSGVGSIVDSALSVNNTMYNTAGSSSPACGLWQPQNCYFIIQRPVPIVPENYGHTVGYACNYQAKISECSGYTQTYNVDVSSINAPESEKNAIAGILNSGFYA